MRQIGERKGADYLAAWLGRWRGVGLTWEWERKRACGALAQAAKEKVGSRGSWAARERSGPGRSPGLADGLRQGGSGEIERADLLSCWA